MPVGAGPAADVAVAESLEHPTASDAFMSVVHVDDKSMRENRINQKYVTRWV